MQWDQERLRLPTLSHCRFANTSPVTQPAAHVLHRHHTPNFCFQTSFSSPKSFVVLLGEACLLETAHRQAAFELHMNSEKACLVTWLHVTVEVQGTIPTCKGMFMTANNWDHVCRAKQICWTSTTLMTKPNLGWRQLKFPHLSSVSIFVNKLTLSSMAKKELSSQVKADNSLHCAPQILLWQSREGRVALDLQN